MILDENQGENHDVSDLSKYEFYCPIQIGRVIRKKVDIFGYLIHF